MEAVRQGEEGMDLVRKILGSGGSIIAAFVLGGIILGLLVAPLTYPVFLKVFRGIHTWRENRRTFKALSRKSDGQP